MRFENHLRGVAGASALTAAGTQNPHHPTTEGTHTMIGAIILGIVAGFLARALMPGKDPMGFFATILLGLAGALVGFFLFTELLGIGDNEMFDLGGLVGAIIGALLLLGIYRVVVGNRRGHAGRRPATR